MLCYATTTTNNNTNNNKNDNKPTNDRNIQTNPGPRRWALSVSSAY